jgi:hypothetical protein
MFAAQDQFSSRRNLGAEHRRKQVMFIVFFDPAIIRYRGMSLHLEHRSNDKPYANQVKCDEAPKNPLVIDVIGLAFVLAERKSRKQQHI